MTPETQPANRRHGCLFYGCIAGAVCMVAILVAFLLGMHMYKKVLNQYTDTKPMALPKVELSASQVEAVQRRVDGFQDAVAAGRPTPPLELTSDDLNAIIGTRADFQSIKDKVYLRVEGDKVNAQVSVPMDQIALPMFKGRYLNGQATFAVSVENGMLRVVPASIEVKGKPLPETYMEKLRTENLAQGVNQNPKASASFNRLERVEVKDGKIVLVPKTEK